MNDPFYWVFIHEELRKYMVLSDDELGCADSIRWNLYEQGFNLLWDSAASRKQARNYIAEFYPDYSRFDAIPVPISFREACSFVDKHHRHHPAPQGMKFAIGISNGLHLIGVIIAGRPVSRYLDTGLTLEVTRLCVLDAYKHACSKLYASVARIAREMGYRSLISYTLVTEPGTSLKAAGFQF